MLAIALTGVLFSLELMKKSLAIFFTILSALLILDSVNFSHAIMMFLLAGVIPGTNITLDGAQMLEFIALVAGFVVARTVTYLFNLRLSERYFQPKAATLEV